MSDLSSPTKRPRRTSPSGDGGGFVIHCSDDETFAISSQDAELLQDACDYFRTIFRHNTIETSTRIIHKPDWAHDTVKLLLTLILKGNVSVTNLDDLVRVTSAADQILLDYGMYSPFEQGELFTQDIKTSFLDLADPSKCVFEFHFDGSSNTSSYPIRILSEYKLWLQKGIFHSIDWKMFVIVRSNNSNNELAQHNEMGQNINYVHYINNYTSWNVHAYDPVQALQHLCQGLKRVTIEPESIEYYKLGVLYPINDIDDNLAVEIATETCGRSFTATFWEEIATLSGPLNILNDGFKTMRKHLKHNKVILRIKTSSPNVIANIIEACCFHCYDHKGSIGIDITGSIVLFKTIYDMSSILSFLAAKTTTTTTTSTTMTTMATTTTAPTRDTSTTTCEKEGGSSSSSILHGTRNGDDGDDENDENGDHHQERRRKLFDEPFLVKFIDGDCFVMDSSMSPF